MGFPPSSQFLNNLVVGYKITIYARRCLKERNTMKQNQSLSLKTILISLLAMLVVLTTACAGTAATEPVNTQATIDAAVAATANAEFAAQATIEAAVEATVLAETADAASTEPVATPVPTLAVADTATISASTGTGGDVAPEYYQISEEELVLLIDQAVDEAVQATNQYSEAAAEATDDNTVTTQEVETVEVYVDTAEAAIANAEELLYIYYDLYGGLYYDLAVEAVDSVDELAVALEEIAEAVEETNEILIEIEDTLDAGLDLSEDLIDQLNQSADAAEARANELQVQTEQWQTDYQTQLQARLDAVENMPPTDVADTPQAALEDVFSFVQESQQALSDQQLTIDELFSLAQQGANAGAGLEVQGLAGLAGANEKLPAVLEQFARGDVVQAAALAENLGVETALATPPSEVAQDLPAILGQARDFATVGRDALADGTLTPPEMSQLAQQSANVRASLGAQNNPQLSELAGGITAVTEQAARGDIGQARGSLDGIDLSLGTLQPGGLDLPQPERPSIEKPSIEIPERPSREGRGG
jgi:hypothetical protein